MKRKFICHISSSSNKTDIIISIRYILVYVACRTNTATLPYVYQTAWVECELNYDQQVVSQDFSTVCRTLTLPDRTAAETIATAFHVTAHQKWLDVLRVHLAHLKNYYILAMILSPATLRAIAVVQPAEDYMALFEILPTDFLNRQQLQRELIQYLAVKPACDFKLDEKKVDDYQNKDLIIIIFN